MSGRFAVDYATTFGGIYGLVCFFDCLHDMGDPVGACSHACDHLAPGGTLMLIEPFADDDIAGNLNPVGAAYYGFSTLLCTPSSLSQDTGTALVKYEIQISPGGAQARFEPATKTSTVFPGLMIVLTVLAVSFLGDALRDALDPHLRRRA